MTIVACVSGSLMTMMIMTMMIGLGMGIETKDARFYMYKRRKKKKDKKNTKKYQRFARDKSSRVHAHSYHHPHIHEYIRPTTCIHTIHTIHIRAHTHTHISSESLYYILVIKCWKRRRKWRHRNPILPAPRSAMRVIPSISPVPLAFIPTLSLGKPREPRNQRRQKRHRDANPGN